MTAKTVKRNPKKFFGFFRDRVRSVAVAMSASMPRRPCREHAELLREVLLTDTQRALEEAGEPRQRAE